MKRIFTIFLAITLTLTIVIMPTYAVTFSDLSKEHWAYDNIIKLAERGIINGYTDGTFKAEKKVTYAEFMKLVVCHLFPENKILPEIKDTHWATRYIRTAEIYGGIGRGSIAEEKYDMPIPRIEMIKYLSIFDEKLIGYNYEVTKDVEFTDISELSEENLEHIKRVVNRGYIIGNPNGNLNPNSALSRAEMVTILTRI